MDQTHSVADDINKILRAVESLTNTVQGLSTRVQCAEEELQNFKQNKFPNHFYNPVVYDDTPRSFDPKDLPPFPVRYNNVHVFRKWIHDVGKVFELCELSGEEEARHVATTFPKNFPWWAQIQKLHSQIGDNNPITFSEIKKMFMASFFSQGDSLLTNNDQ